MLINVVDACVDIRQVVVVWQRDFVVCLATNVIGRVAVVKVKVVDAFNILTLYDS
jgi:hypothetical protein